MLRLSHLATLTLLALTLAGCSPTVEPTPTASPSASADEPLFASEEEAVAAAEAHIAKYWEAANAVFQAGGGDVELLAQVVTEDRYEGERKVAEIFVSQELHQSGSYTFDTTRFQDRFESAEGETIVVTTCVDYSDVVVSTLDGRRIEQANSEPRLLHQVVIRAGGMVGDPKLLLHESEPVQGTTC